MQQYYTISCPYGPNYADCHMLNADADVSIRSWTALEPFGTDPNGLPEDHHPPEPVKFWYNRREKADVLRLFYEVPAPLVTEKIADIILSLDPGALRKYKAEISNKKTGETTTDYVAFQLLKHLDRKEVANQITAGKAPPLFRLSNRGRSLEMLWSETLKKKLHEAGYTLLQFSKYNVGKPTLMDEILTDVLKK